MFFCVFWLLVWSKKKLFSSRILIHTSYRIFSSSKNGKNMLDRGQNDGWVGNRHGVILICNQL